MNQVPLMTSRVNKLPQHHRKLLAVRMGVSDTTLRLLQRAQGLDLLLANEQVHEVVEDTPVEQLGEGAFIRIITTEQLFFPVPGYSGADQ